MNSSQILLLTMELHVAALECLKNQCLMLWLLLRLYFFILAVTCIKPWMRMSFG